MKIVKDLHDLSGHQEWVFPSIHQKGEPIGKTTMLAALRGMGIESHEMTPHGFRAMARTLLDEVLGERYDLIEHQLAHMVRDQTRMDGPSVNAFIRLCCTSFSRLHLGVKSITHWMSCKMTLMGL